MQTLANLYSTGPNGLPDLDAIARDTVKGFKRLPFAVEYTEFDPYSHPGALCPSLDKIRAEVIATGRLYVYSGGTESLLPRDIALMARAVHDADHLSIGAGFDLTGESATARVASHRAPHLASWYASEIIGQAAYTLATGIFPVQRFTLGLDAYL